MKMMGSFKNKPKLAIITTFDFEAIHNFPSANNDVAFLRNLHRHKFSVIVEVTVYSSNREIEFIKFKRSLIKQFPGGDIGEKSCESLAIEIAKYVEILYPERPIKVTVLEDGENGVSCKLNI